MGRMVRSRSPRVRRHRQHGVVLEQEDRRELERIGWRTTLDYHENHVRARNGQLLQVQEIWHAEAERDAVRTRRRSLPDRSQGHGIDVITATAPTVEAVWKKLRVEAELADVRVAIPRPAPRSTHSAA
jgi:hypothetical protein